MFVICFNFILIVLNRIHALDSPSVTVPCAPDICHGADLSTIYPLVGNVPESYLSVHYLIDTERLLNCFHNKTITFLGDDTMTEVIHDIVIILSRLGEDYRDYIQFATHVYHGDVLVKEYQPTAANETLKLTFYETQRHMLVEYPSRNIKLYHRFTGNKQIRRNSGGLITLMDEDFSSTLKCLIGLSKPSTNSTNATLNCYENNPDIVIFGTGHYDISGDHTAVEMNDKAYQDIMKLFRQSKDEKVDIYWKSNILLNGTSAYDELYRLDQIAKKYSKQYNVTMIDFDDEIASILEFIDLSTVTEYYPHIGAVGAFQNNKFPITFQTLLTQKLLRDICM